MVENENCLAAALVDSYDMVASTHASVMSRTSHISESIFGDPETHDSESALGDHDFQYGNDSLALIQNYNESEDPDL